MPRTDATRAIREIVRTTDWTYAKLAGHASCGPENIRRACEHWGEDLSIDVFEEVSHALTAAGEKRHLDALDASPNGGDANGTLEDEMADMIRHLARADEALESSNFGDARTAIADMQHVMERVRAEYDLKANS